MKRHRVAVLSLLLATALPGANLSAQFSDPAEPLVVPFIGGGLAMGTGDLSRDTNSGWFVLGGVDVPLPSVATGFSAGLTGSFSQIPYGGGFDEATQVTALSAEGSYRIGSAASMVRPYVRAGAGVQIHRYDPGELLTPAIWDTRPALSAGAGVSIMMGAADAVLGARFGSGTDAGFVGLHAGVAIPVGASR
jgi:hypothetical protein